ncbi:MAG TPA: 4Fe-4S binding protein [Pseudomonas sp.]
MALKIVESCVNCWACVDVCPSEAISQGSTHFKISAHKCTECDGDFTEQQCASICPIEGAILLADGSPANPPGSLTGIPPERLAEAMREIQAR